MTVGERRRALGAGSAIDVADRPPLVPPARTGNPSLRTWTPRRVAAETPARAAAKANAPATSPRRCRQPERRSPRLLPPRWPGSRSPARPRGYLTQERPAPGAGPANTGPATMAMHAIRFAADHRAHRPFPTIGRTPRKRRSCGSTQSPGPRAGIVGPAGYVRLCHGHGPRGRRLRRGSPVARRRSEPPPNDHRAYERRSGRRLRWPG